jgi:uncharacterized protein DUF3551
MFRNWSASERTSIVMTRLLVSVFVLVTALLVTDRSVLVQQSAYSYPWCLERGIGGPRSCYYSSYEQCWQEAFTRLGGGFCTESPYYRPNPDRFVGKEAPRHRRHRPLAAK